MITQKIEVYRTHIVSKDAALYGCCISNMRLRFEDTTRDVRVCISLLTFTSIIIIVVAGTTYMFSMMEGVDWPLNVLYILVKILEKKIWNSFSKTVYFGPYI